MGRRTYKDFTKGATSIGTFVWPHLNEPNKRFKKEFGEWSVDLDLQGQVAAALQKLIEEAYEVEYAFECEAKGKELPKFDGRPFKQATDGKEKEPIPGVTRFTFKRGAGGVYGDRHPKSGQHWEASVPVLGASGNVQVTEPIGSGTRGRVSFRVKPWVSPMGDFFGVTLSLEAVKVIELVTFGGSSASDFGFEDEEGYVPPANATPQPTPNDMESNDGATGVGAEAGGGTEF